MNGATPLFPQYDLMDWAGKSLTFYLSFTLIFSVYAGLIFSVHAGLIFSVYAGTHTDGPALYINKENKCDK
jgi:hypothetical protein